MVDSNSNFESNSEGINPEGVRLVGERMVEVDSKIPSPAQRAEKVLALIRKDQNDLPTVWDTVCFAAEYIGSQVATLPFLEASAKEMLLLVYGMHYQYPASIDPTYPAEANDESNSKQGTQEASVNETGNDSGNESHS